MANAPVPTRRVRMDPRRCEAHRKPGPMTDVSDLDYFTGPATAQHPGRRSSRSRLRGLIDLHLEFDATR